MFLFISYYAKGYTLHFPELSRLFGNLLVLKFCGSPKFGFFSCDRFNCSMSYCGSQPMIYQPNKASLSLKQQDTGYYFNINLYLLKIIRKAVWGNNDVTEK